MTRPAELDLDTPYLVVDLEILQDNVRRMAEHTGERGMTLRPHAKTHKCVEIARRQLAAGAGGLTVATLGEAEVFAAAGITDLFIAYPLWAAGDRARRLARLAEKARLRVGIDNAGAAELLARAAGSAIEAVVEVDSGQHRSGVAPAVAGKLALATARAGLRVVDVFTFPGHSYTPGAPGPAARDEATALAEATAALRTAGLAAEVRSGGSTPTALLADHNTLSELRPGVYVFNDAQQVELGTCDWSAVALTVAATVVSTSRGQVVLDSGSKALGADRAPWASGAGRLLDHPGARITGLSEHHAVVTAPEAGPLPTLGEVVRVVPNHVCAAVNLADEMRIVSSGRPVDRWPVAARGANA